jgi:hypothetical protein
MYFSWPKRYEATEEWRRLHTEELYDLYCSPNTIRVVKSRRVRRTKREARMGNRRGAYMALVDRTDGKRPLGRSRRGWEINIKIKLQECDKARSGLSWLRIGTCGGGL